MKGKQTARSTQARHRILVVDDHPMTRYGVIQLINEQPDMVACGEAENTRRALALVATSLPDLVLADITLPDKSGLDLIRELRQLQPDIPVLIMSMHDETLYAERVLRAGGRGYVMKTEGGGKLLDAIREVLHGRVFVSGKITTGILDRLTHRMDQTAQPRPGTLTDREFEVFQLLGQGLSTGQIAQRLNLSPKTIGVHRIHIKSKLGLQSGPELIRRAVQWGATQQLF